MSRHSREDMKRALQLYPKIGPRAASRETGIPANTIIANARRNGIKPRQNERTKKANATNKLKNEQVRLEVSKLAISGSHKALKLIVHRMNTQGHDIPVKDLAVIFGILADKHMSLAQDGVEGHNAVDAWLGHITGGDES